MPAKGYEKVNIEQLAAFCRVKPTLEDCAAFFKCSERTIERIIKKHTDLTFVEFRDQNMVHTRHMIIREILQQCKKGNMTALIFASKNLCGWSDKNETNAEVNQKIKIETQDKDL